MPTLFISDLHLCAERPAITRLFMEFLEHEAANARALYILGDFMEYWIGDEAIEQADHRPVIDALRGITDRGVPVFVMHGNRDFLMGHGFEAASGCRLIGDPTIIDLYGTRVLLMHGDSLCIDDHEYMAFRALVRNPEWQKAVLAKSVEEREALSRQYREYSKMSTANKKPEIMDVNQGEVEAEMRRHGVRHLIHGHTHRPAQHEFPLDDAPAYRTVLGDWYDQGSVLRCDETGCRLETLALAAAPGRGSQRAGA